MSSPHAYRRHVLSRIDAACAEFDPQAMTTADLEAFADALETAVARIRGPELFLVRGGVAAGGA